MQIQTAVIERSLSATSLEQCLGTAEAMERIILALQAENDEA